MQRAFPPASTQASLRDVDRARLPDHRHLHLARVLEVVLDLARDLVREQDRSVVVDLVWLHDHANLPPCLERVDALDAGVRLRELLERREALDVVLEALAARSGS